MFIHRIKVAGLLSFGPTGIDLPLQGLNVLIGPNGAGKSNLLAVLSLLKAAPDQLAHPIQARGGVKEWLWQGPGSKSRAVVETIVDYPPGPGPLRHLWRIAEHGARLEVTEEQIAFASPAQEDPTNLIYRFQGKRAVLRARQKQQRPWQWRREELKPEESILSQVRGPATYPALRWLQSQYRQMALYRDTNLATALRQAQSSRGLDSFLSETGENAALVFNSMRLQTRSELLPALSALYPNIQGLHIKIVDGRLLFLLEEGSGIQVPATHLGDGTLHYLCLLLVLLHPNPPPLIALEEPETGLHPDVIPELADLLVRASQRTQLIVTTYSPMLIDALSDHAASVVVCTREEGQSRFERLDAEDLKAWLHEYSLGDLWNMGKIGGNRW